MADNIVVTYKDNLDQLTRDLKAYRDQQLGISKGVEDFGNKSKVAGDKASSALKETGKQTSTTTSLFNKLGAQIAAAFSVAAVISWSKTTLDAYKEQEKALTQLRASLETVANEGTQAFGKLVSQAERLQKVSIFSDEQIEQTQTALVNFGLTSRQVEILTARIVDFASRTGKSLEESTGIFLRAIQGQTRGLIDAGAKFDDTGSRIGNFNALLQATEKFAGGASTALKTQAGELTNIGNQIDDLNEKTGRSLAGVELFFAKAKLRFAEFIELFSRTGNIGFSLSEFFFGKEPPTKLPKELDNVAKAVDTIAAKRERLFQASLGKGILGLSDKEIQDEIKRLNSLAESNTIAVKDRIDALTKELEERKKNSGKLIEQAKKEAQERKQAQEALKDFTLKTQQDNLTAEESQRKLAAAETIRGEENLAKEFIAIEIETLNKRLALLIEFQQPTADIEKQIADKRIEQIKRAADVDTKQRDAHIKDYEKWLKEQEKLNKEAEEKKRDQIQQTFDLAQDLTNSLQDLFRAQTDEDLSRVEKERDTRVTAIDEQIKALEEANDKGRLSDKKFEEQKKQLLLQREAAEKKALQEQNEIKRKEAEREKLLSIFRIGLILAEAIALVDVFKIIAAAAQLAVVAATPIPAFKRGTDKYGTRKSGLARVGEEGEEIVFLPQGSQVLTAGKTRKYKEAIDSMIEGTFDEKYVYKAMIASALRDANRQAEKQRQKTFAENVAHLFNVKAEVDPYRLADGIKSNNKELAWQIGKAVAKNLNTGYKNPRYH